MGRPHPLLIEVAAGRPARGGTRLDADLLLASAAEHRMTGLLWTRVQSGELDLAAGPTAILAKQDLHSRSRNLRLWRTLAEVQRRLGEEGIEVAVAKGVAAELRWYTRIGERPCNDIDLVLAPRDLDRIEDVVRLVQPTHPLRGKARQLMMSGVLQSVDLDLAGVEVDLHADLLKFEIPTRQKDLLFASTTRVDGPEGVVTRALSPELSLVHFLLHLNKDNFARLLAYADVARILARDSDLDWQLIDDFVRGEGLRTHVYGALHEVTSRLGLPPAPVPVPAGARAALWQALWPTGHRLSGRAGVIRQRRRQLLIPWTADGRLTEAAAWWWRRRIFPPEALVDLYYAGTSGPYVLRLVTGRWSVARRDRQVVKALAAVESQPDGTLYKTFPPRWSHIQVPTGSRRAGQAALALYAPCLPRGLVTRDLAWFGTALLGPRMALPGRSRPLAPPVPPDIWRALRCRWQADLGGFDELAVYGRPQAGRSGFAVLLQRAGRSVAFVRVSRSPAAGLSREHAVLCQLADAAPTFWAPVPLCAGEEGGWSFLAMTAMPPQRHRPAAPPIAEVLTEIATCLAGLARPADVPEHWQPMHGDLTPWNCRRVRGRRTMIVDWEDAGWGPPQADEVYFRATYAALSGTAPGPGPAEAVRFWAARVTARDVPGSREAIGKLTLEALERMAAS